MTRNSSLSESVELKSVTSRTSELSDLNDEECKRILAVVERDFQLRQKEYERIEKMKKTIRSENDRAEYLGASKEFNEERCIRCFKPFRLIINPKECCYECKFNVCHECSTYVKEKKSYACKTCIKLKELEVLTSNWFYLQSSNKHKRCGSAKVVRELHKREEELAELDELDDDLGYGTLTIGSVISYVNHDNNVKRELKEYSSRLKIIVDKLQADLAERNTYNNHRSVRGKSKETLKTYQQELTTEIARARVALSGPLRRSNVKSSTTHERDLQTLLINETEQVLQTNLQHFQKANSTANSTNFDQKLSQTIFDKCVSREIFQELPQVIDTSTEATTKVQRQTSTSSSLTSLTKPSWSNSSGQPSSSTTWEIKSRHDKIRKVNLTKPTVVDEEEDTEKEDEQQNTNEIHRRIPLTDEIRFDNGLKLDLSSVDENSSRQDRRRSIDSDYDAIRESRSRVGDWQTNFTLVESKSSSQSVEETSRSTRESVFLTVPTSERKDLSPRIGDKPLEDLADDDLYVDDESSSIPIPINTTTIFDPSQISENDESTQQRKLFPLPANLLLQNHSSCSFRRPSYTYESDNESITSSNLSFTEMKTFIDEENFRMDPNISDPKFVIQPRDTTVRYGETAKFKTRITGTEPIDVFWFRFGTDDELINDEKYQLSHDDNYHYLKIYSTNKDDEGAYLCVIANDKAQNVDMVKLSVKDNKRTFNPPRIIQSFRDCDVTEGSSLTLTCKLDQGYPKARVLWYKENTLIKPDGHYKLYYYGDGQHTLHVDEATIEDDNGTFTCLALNAAGRVQITADVFVHEKEVIDVPRKSPLLHPYQRNKINEDSSSSMQSNDHLEDQPPMISPPLSPLQHHQINDNDEQYNAKRFIDRFRNEQSTKHFENWLNTREIPVHPLPSDNDEKKLSPAPQPFFLNRSPSIEKPLAEQIRSPPLSPQSHMKPKWEIRLPQLLNSTVGPDRQKRDLSRRHTTTIVFQPEQQTPLTTSTSVEMNNRHSHSLSTSNGEGDRPLSPLVKQLKQKFDRMSANNLTQENNGKSFTQSQTNLNKVSRVGISDDDVVLVAAAAAYPLLPDVYRQEKIEIDHIDDDEVASLTCRGLASNNGDRSTNKVRPMLPIRNTSNDRKSLPIDEEKNVDHLRHSQSKGKTTPLIRVHSQTNPSRSTTSNVVKEMIGAGATVVYDSLTPSSHTTNSSPLTSYPYYPNHQQQQQRKEQQNGRNQENLFENLKLNLTQNSSTKPSSTTLTGRAWPTDSHRHPSSTTTTTTTPTFTTDLITTKHHRDSEDSNNDESNSQQHLTSTKETFLRSKSSSDKSSIPATPTLINSNVPVGRKSVLARAELWDRRISTNETDGQTPPPTCDIEQWSSEFEKIQSQT